MPDFDDPFKPPSDATVMRPRPGAGRRPSPDASHAVPAPRAPYAAAPRPDPVPEPVQELLGSGLNPLVHAASPLLLLIGQLRGTLSGPDVGSLRRHALEEIRRFEERARAARVANEVVLAARYALCAALDEAVLSTPWGAHSEWAQQTLLVALHREAWGGEKFFDMLDRISKDPARHIDLMELQYLCLAFGFAGKYQVRDRGHAQLAEVQQDLYRRIREQRGVPPQELSLRWQGVTDRRNPLIRYVPWWVVGAAALVVLTAAFVVYSQMLGREAAPVRAALSQLRRAAFVEAAPAESVPDRRLRELLRAEEEARRVSIAERGPQTIITVPATDMFRSGSATVNARYLDLIRRIGAALDEVPGMVQVVGHTDSTPVSFRYADNFELSRARAASVAEILRQTVRDPTRLQADGAGDTQPIDDANLARNRRVEIIHVRGS